MMNKLFATTLLSTAVAFSAQAQDVTGTIHANQGTQKINREIYGQFAEHLGSCIYGGLWVGPSQTSLTPRVTATTCSKPSRTSRFLS